MFFFYAMLKDRDTTIQSCWVSFWTIVSSRIYIVNLNTERRGGLLETNILNLVRGLLMEIQNQKLLLLRLLCYGVIKNLCYWQQCMQFYFIIL